MVLSFRDWMQDGMTITVNGDAMYMGLRAMPDAPDETETVIAWACQDGTTGSGEVDNIRIQVNSVGQLEIITGGIQYDPRRQA